MSDRLAWATVSPRKHRHEWVPWEEIIRRPLVPNDLLPTSRLGCRFCWKPKDEAISRRGRLNRSRGNSIEREVCKLLGISRVGQYGGSEDGGKAEEWIAVQVKSGGAYPERIDRLLRALPERMARIRGVVHADTPGPGGRRRMLITLDLREFAQWYGGGGEETVA